LVSWKINLFFRLYMLQFETFVGTSILSNKHVVPKQQPQMHTVEIPFGSVSSSSPNHGQLREGRNGFLHNGSLRLDATSNRIIRIGSVGSESPPKVRTFTPQHPRRSRHSVGQRAAQGRNSLRKAELEDKVREILSCSIDNMNRSLCPLRCSQMEAKFIFKTFICHAISTLYDFLLQAKDASRDSTIVHPIQTKEKSITDSDKGLKMAQRTNADKSSKSTSSDSVGSDRKGYFTFQETSLPRHDSSPPSVYCLNALVGLFLFMVVIRELVLYGNW
jgi:hypothetical protein